MLCIFRRKKRELIIKTDISCSRCIERALDTEGEFLGSSQPHRAGQGYLLHLHLPIIGPHCARAALFQTDKSMVNRLT